MSGVSPGLTLPKAINLSEEGFSRLLQSAVIGNSRSKQPVKVHNPSTLLRAELIHLGNVRTRTLLTTRNVQIQDQLIQGPRNTMEEKNQEKQSATNQTLSKISDKLTSLFSKRNFVMQGTHQLQNSTTIANPILANQNAYPIAGNIAASTQTNTAISLQAGETPAEAAINIINLNSSELAEQIPAAFNQSIATLNKISEKISQRPVNASLL